MEAIAIMGGMFALLISAAIVLSVFWIWMLIECIHNKEIKGAEKAFFLLIITFLHWIGGAIYCFSVNRKEKIGCFALISIITAATLTLFAVIGFLFPQQKGITNSISRISTEPKIKPDKQPPQSNYVLLNKSDENRMTANTPKEIANINTSKYSEKLNSWIDSEGKVHFSNTTPRN